MAVDVGNVIEQLPKGSFLGVLQTHREQPATLPEQVRALAAVLAASTAPLAVADIEARFKGKGLWKKGRPAFWKRWKRWAGRGGRRLQPVSAGADKRYKFSSYSRISHDG